MDESEKRRLKKLGKKLVEQQSRELEERLHEANPAPSGSDEWAKNYRTGTERERRLRANPPDRLTAEEVQREFVILPVEGLPGVPTWYCECLVCGDVLHSAPRQSVTCSCGNVRVDIEARQVRSRSSGQARWVKLIGRA